MLVALLAAAGPGCGDDEDVWWDGAVRDGALEPDVGVADVADAAGVDAARPDAGGLDAAVDGGQLGRGNLRVVAGNLTTGNFQSYEGPGMRILSGLSADVALLQELNVGASTPAELRSFVDLTFGSAFAYYREPGVQLPNGIVSRFPILAAGSWVDPQATNRGFAWARIDVPGPLDLWAVSLHLLTASPSTRDTEAAALVQLVQGNVPASDYLVIGGDFNTDVRDEACIATLSAVVSIAPPDPVDQSGNPHSNAGRAKPYDRVLPDDDLLARQTAVHLGTSMHPHGLVFDSRVYAPLSDAAPALIDDSAAPSMQHMAVVKDFLLPL